MDQDLAKQLIRQLKILNLWITIFGTLLLITMIILGVLLFKVVTYAQQTSQKISDIQQKTSQTLDIERQLCDTKTPNSLLQRTNICD